MWKASLNISIVTVPCNRPRFSKMACATAHSNRTILAVKVSLEGAYQMGKRMGTWKYYREDGGLSRTEEYKADKLNGKRIYYFRNGKPDTEVPYENGERIGIYT